MNAKEEEEAIFWCTLLTPVLFGEPDPDEVRRYLRELSKREVVFPNGSKRKPSRSTLKRKLAKYRRGGFNAMARKPRNDRGKARAVPEEVIDTAIAAKKDQPKRSALMLNRILKHRHGKTVARSTLYRHLKKAGATRLKLGVTKSKVRKRWSKERTHEMWVGDFEYGPYVLHDGRAARSYLSAFIDVCSRYIVAARYYVRQNFDVLCDTLIRAFESHGFPLWIYLDNGKVYHAHALKCACYRLGTGLVHRTPKDPATGGIIERFFETAQSQYESEARATDVLTLERLNEGFAAWLDLVYHAEPHSETGQPPKERYDQRLIAIRQADMQAVAESFLQQEQRTVEKTFSDIRLNNRFYKVNPDLRGDRLTVRFDLRGPIDEILLYSLEDVYLGKGILHQREEGQDLPPPNSQPAARFDLLGMLIDEHRNQLKEQIGGIDYSVMHRPRRRWPFEAFAACLANFLGRQGGLSAFNAEELNVLTQVHSNHPNLTRTLLKKAFASAERPTLSAVVYQLQKTQED
jgi:transposase InsO family protein